MTLEKDIHAWDEKNKEDITQIYERYKNTARFTHRLVTLAAKPLCTVGATWLLKHHLEAGAKLTQRQYNTILGTLVSTVNWQPKLHILQMLPLVKEAVIPQELVGSIERCLRDGLSDENTFIRAWSYNGWYVLSEQYPEYKKEVMQFFNMALKDEAASVKARIRQLLKRFN